MDIALTISNRQISPQVVNMFQFENGTTTLNFTLDSYMYGEVNLRNYKAYAVTSINGNIDMTELVSTYDAGKDKLTLSWNVKEYTLLEAGAILFQIVFKEATASGIPEEGENTGVFYSYKAVLINRESIDGDNEISAKYPTLLKQWLDRMNAMADLYDAGVIYMNYGESIPVEDRLSGRLYFQYTDTLNTKGQFEDDKGNILSDPDVVHLFGNETIGGQKTFTTSPKVPTPAADSNDTTVANTAFIKNAVKGALTNTATMSGALTILGTASNWSRSVNVGSNSSVTGVEGTAVGSSADAANSGAALGYGANATGIASTALGAGATASAARAIAIGSIAQATAEGAIQIGTGTNSAQLTLQILGYQLLNLSNGLISLDRIPTLTADKIPDLSAKYAVVDETTGVIPVVKIPDLSSKYLPLAGGTLTGTLTGTDLNLSGNIYGVSTDQRLHIGGGTHWNNGAHLALSGMGHSDNPGGFNLCASNGDAYCALIGKADGGFSWNGKPIVVLVAEQKPTSSNGYTWYRKYSDGWVEQGGYHSGLISSANDGSKTFNLPVQMSDANYTLVLSEAYQNVSSMNGKASLTDKTSTYFTFRAISLAGNARWDKFSWYASGYAA